AGSPQPSQPDPHSRLGSEDPAEPTQADGAIVIVRRVHLDLRRGDRIGVLGRNGAGKSTLVRTLVGELDVLQGDRTHARALRIGYFAQRQVESLDPHASALEHLRRIAPAEREQVLREFLAGFGFRGEQAIVAVEPFSGGEKARLALALIAWTRPQLLVLDEPTNHLDSSARDALTAALADYEGALLLVSHDRGLLRATVDRFVIVAGGQMSPFDGDLEDYRDWLATQNRSTDGVSASGPGSIQGVASVSVSASSGQTGQRPATAQHPVGIAAGPGVLPTTADRREERRQAASAREHLQRQRKPLQTRLNRLEAELGRLQNEIDALDTQMADPEFLKSGTRVVAAQRARADLTRQLEQTEEEWLMLSTELEALSVP
ncbi:MAG: ATP-binding cassette domain-containing protein, partial [Betaproteobacteria bacterium]|nr:ATP-binding cassette domain-containing protein [Betaproteobacteria bacterium]